MTMESESSRISGVMTKLSGRIVGSCAFSTRDIEKFHGCVFGNYNSIQYRLKRSVLSSNS
jgi:hypothetical protein